jgi:hypothetical protein
MRCSDAWRALACSIVLAVAMPALAHKASDAYLQIESAVDRTSLRWDIALRDLDAALDLDVDGDGRLTWGEVKAGWPQIESYALSHLRIDGCELKSAGRGLERRNDGAYAVLHLAAACRLGEPPAIDYRLFREVDPTHRGIAKVQRAGQPLLLMVLDPTVASSTGAAASGTENGVAPSQTTAHPQDGSNLGFAKEGVRHILTGYDHVLFLLCLLFPSVMRRTPDGWRPVERLSQAVWPVVGIVSAFTVAHSITLGLAAMKMVSLPSAVIEPAIALTIILAALDNVRPLFPVRRVIVTFLFGLIHGFGFAGVLAELDLPTARFAWALLQFNLGLEFGQLLIVVAVTGVLFLIRRGRRYPGWVIGGGSVAAMLMGVLWLVERTANVSLLGF